MYLNTQFLTVYELLSTSRVLKTAFSTFPDTEMCLYELHKTSTGVEMALIGPSRHLNRLARVSQQLHSDENCFLDLSWQLNRLARASQDFQSGENCILRLSWALNRPAGASQGLHCGENGLVGPSLHLNRPVRVTQHLHCDQNCLLDHCWL